MENINIKPTTLGISLVVFIISVTFIIYKYIDNKMKTKMQRHKRKLKKHYETQFNQMFYNNTQNTNENQPSEPQHNHNIKFEDNNEPDGYDSNSSSSIESDHAEIEVNQKILDDDYKKYGNEKMTRGNK
jgi:hypothetical protein